MILTYIEHESLVPAFIEKHLGSQAVADFKKDCEEGIKPISENASYEEKYETAYSDWIWMGETAFSFVRKHLGEDEIKQFMRADVEATKQENASPALFLLRLIRAASPGLAFTMTAKQVAYKLQWLSPYSVSEFSRNRIVMDLPCCELVSSPESEDLCLICCQVLLIHG